jgi:hypothetical protein
VFYLKEREINKLSKSIEKLKLENSTHVMRDSSNERKLDELLNNSVLKQIEIEEEIGKKVKLK